MTQREKAAIYAKQYQLKNKEKLRKYKSEWTRNWRLEHPAESRLKARKMARKYRLKYLDRVRKQTSKGVKAWRLRNPEKVTAHRKIYSALRNGTIVKEPCFCGEEKVQAHHEDYSKPLEIVWLCKFHHTRADLNRKGKL